MGVRVPVHPRTVHLKTELPPQRNNQPPPRINPLIQPTHPHQIRTNLNCPHRAHTPPSTTTSQPQRRLLYGQDIQKRPGRRWCNRPGQRRGRSAPRAWGGPLRRDVRVTRRPEHPHVRGEDVTKKVRTLVDAGAPPRAWGGHVEQVVDRVFRRSTPTCVGRTDVPTHDGVFPRSTPTCVGRTPTPAPNTSPQSEHPHVRGEDTVNPRELAGFAGAPPRAWGGPARLSQMTTPTWEHPHVRGEDFVLAPECPPFDGAPPRAWGGPPPELGTTQSLRSTPTCVGRTASPHSPGRSLSEHPHVRGEDTAATGAAKAHTGAPPRAWGGRMRRGGVIGGFRSTPTCVGRTGTGHAADPGSPEHPHVRGQDPATGAAGECAYGAPPRAWAGHEVTGKTSAGVRSTPTCVGRTLRDLRFYQP